MPQKHHEKAAEHLDQAAKHHRSAAKNASDGNHEKAAHHAQAAHGHQSKAKDYASRASSKYAERAGTMKNEEGEEQELEETSNGRGRRSHSRSNN